MTAHSVLVSEAIAISAFDSRKMYN